MSELGDSYRAIESTGNNAIDRTVIAANGYTRGEWEVKMSTGDLARATCTPCRGGIPPMEEEKAREMVTRTPGWELFDDATRIRRRYRMEDFAAAIDLVEDIADVAEEQGHHPDLRISGPDVEVVLWTHAIDGLHENDFIMAAKIEELFEERS